MWEFVGILMWLSLVAIGNNKSVLLFFGKIPITKGRYPFHFNTFEERLHLSGNLSNSLVYPSFE